jgi:DinB superfamily
MAGLDEVDRNLESLRARLAEIAAREAPAGLTKPDPGGTERWEAAQVWAHVAEFVGYWHEQLATVVQEYDGTPIPFGRVKTDPGRIDAIEAGRHRPIAELAREADAAIASLARYLATLDDAAWTARGLHQTRGELDLQASLKRFVIDHLDEHAAQLEGLGAA